VIMKKITLYVEDQHKDYLQKKVGKTGTMSWYVRMLISADMIKAGDLARRRNAIFPTVSQNE